VTVLIQLSERPVQPEKNLLGCVLGIFQIPVQQAQGRKQHATLVEAQDRFKSGHVARLGLFHQPDKLLVPRVDTAAFHQ
jgi:hypothetical protein